MNGSANGNVNGGIMKAKPNMVSRMPKTHRVTDSQQVRDAEEFELEGLISDVDEDAEDVGSVKTGKRDPKEGEVV